MCTEVWKMTKFRQYLSMAAIFYGYILGKMLYFSIIMTTTGIKWCNDGIPGIFEFWLKNVFWPKISKFWFLSEIVVHMTANAKLKTPSKSEHSNARYDLLKMRSNQELHIPMQIALNNRKVQNGIYKICHVHLTDGQNEMRFWFLCFLIEREHIWQKVFCFFFWDKKHIFFIKITDFWNSIKTLFYSFNSQHYRNGNFP